MTTIPKTRISELTLITEADSTTVIPVSTGTPISTKKIRPNDLIKGTAALASKANLSGGNEFTNNQFIDGALTVSEALYAQSDMKLDGSFILDKEQDIEYTDETSMRIGKLYHLNDVTGDIQAQLNSKASTSELSAGLSTKANVASPSFTGTVNATNISFIDGIAFASMSVPSGTLAQHAVNKSQLDLKANLNMGNSFEGNQVFDDDVEIQGALSVFGNVSLGSISNTEIQALDGVESNIQGQLDSKAGLNSANTFSSSNIFNSGIVVGGGLVSNGTTYINNTLYAGDTVITNDQLKTLYGINSGAGVTIQSQFNSLYQASDDLAINKVDGTERHLDVKLTQVGTASPTMVVLKNTAIPGALSAIRTGEGSYEIVRASEEPITAIVVCDKENVIMKSGTNKMFLTTDVNTHRIIIETVNDGTNSYSDGMLDNNVLRFTFYNT